MVYYFLLFITINYLYQLFWLLCLPRLKRTLMTNNNGELSIVQHRAIIASEMLCISSMTPKLRNRFSRTLNQTFRRVKFGFVKVNQSLDQSEFFRILTDWLVKSN